MLRHWIAAARRRGSAGKPAQSKAAASRSTPDAMQ